MNDLAIRVPGRVVFGRAHFEDGRPAVNVADLMFLHPSEPYTLGAVGLQMRFAGSPPWMTALDLPGTPFGKAVAATLPKSVVDGVMRGEGGRAFTDCEVADFLRPVLDTVARCERILAGVAAPPSADPVYIRISPVMLPHWRFIAGEDRAEPNISGAIEYLALRVFTPAEFSFVDRCGGKLRPVASASAASADELTTDERRAAEWMRTHVTRYIANQRDDRVSECMKALGVRKPAAKAGWSCLSEDVKGVSRQPK